MWNISDIFKSILPRTEDPLKTYTSWAGQRVVEQSGNTIPFRVDWLRISDGLAIEGKFIDMNYRGELECDIEGFMSPTGLFNFVATRSGMDSLEFTGKILDLNTVKGEWSTHSRKFNGSFTMNMVDTKHFVMVRSCLGAKATQEFRLALSKSGLRLFGLGPSQIGYFVFRGKIEVDHETKLRRFYFDLRFFGKYNVVGEGVQKSLASFEGRYEIPNNSRGMFTLKTTELDDSVFPHYAPSPKNVEEVDRPIAKMDSNGVITGVMPNGDVVPFPNASSPTAYNAGSSPMIKAPETQPQVRLMAQNPQNPNQKPQLPIPVTPSTSTSQSLQQQPAPVPQPPAQPKSVNLPFTLGRHFRLVRRREQKGRTTKTATCASQSTISTSSSIPTSATQTTCISYPAYSTTAANDSTSCSKTCSTACSTTTTTSCSESSSKICKRYSNFREDYLEDSDGSVEDPRTIRSQQLQHQRKRNLSCSIASIAFTKVFNLYQNHMLRNLRVA